MIVLKPFNEHDLKKKKKNGYMDEFPEWSKWNAPY